jgi:hypothetical protein
LEAPNIGVVFKRVPSAVEEDRDAFHSRECPFLCGTAGIVARFSYKAESVGERLNKSGRGSAAACEPDCFV